MNDVCRYEKCHKNADCVIETGKFGGLKAVCECQDRDFLLKFVMGFLYEQCKTDGYQCILLY